MSDLLYFTYDIVSLGGDNVTELEQLENEAYEDNVEIVDYHFYSNRIKGLYCDGTVALSSTIKTDTEKKCILAEELGHHHTAFGNITGDDISSRKQELHGRLYAYDKLIGLNGILRAYQRGCRSMHDTAEFLDVTEDFLLEALNKYRQRYGVYTIIDNYVIYFEPSLGVFELI